MGANRRDFSASNSWGKAITKTADDRAAWTLEHRRTDDEGYERTGCAQIRAVTHRHWLYNLDFYDCYTPKPFLEAMRLWRQGNDVDAAVLFARALDGASNEKYAGVPDGFAGMVLTFQ
jgi:hypothetical protein